MHPLSQVNQQFRNELHRLNISSMRIRLPWPDFNDFNKTFCHTFLGEEVEPALCPQSISIVYKGSHALLNPMHIQEHPPLDSLPVMKMHHDRRGFAFDFDSLNPVHMAYGSLLRPKFDFIGLASLVTSQSQLFVGEWRSGNLQKVIARPGSQWLTIEFVFREAPFRPRRLVPASICSEQGDLERLGFPREGFRRIKMTMTVLSRL